MIEASYYFLGSNMPCTPEAIDVLRKANVLVAPAIAAGAGGVWMCIVLSYFKYQKNSDMLLLLGNKQFLWSKPDQTLRNICHLPIKNVFR